MKTSTEAHTEGLAYNFIGENKSNLLAATIISGQLL